MKTNGVIKENWEEILTTAMRRETLIIEIEKRERMREKEEEEERRNCSCIIDCFSYYFSLV